MIDSDWLDPDEDTNPSTPLSCPYKAPDPIFPTQSAHFCTETINHDSPHECLCGYRWTAAA